MDLHASPAGGPGLAQERRLVTEIPGPASRELLERRQRSVARGLSHVLPVFVTAAGGGVIVDADGNSLIDFGSGIAVTSVGNSAELVVERVTKQVAQFTHTCFMVVPYQGYVEVCEELNRRATMTSGRPCSTQARRPSRTQSRSPGTRPGGPRSWSSTTPTMAGPISPWR